MPPSGPKGRVIAARNYEIKAIEGRGRGLFLTEDVKAGDTILLEEPAVVGPKQMSPLVVTCQGDWPYWMKFWCALQVCVECLEVSPILEDFMPCAKCGAILCERCFHMKSSATWHGKECSLFVEAGHKFQIRLAGPVENKLRN